MTYHLRKPELIPTIVVILVTGLMFKFGFWQLDRLEWKTSLLASIEKAQSEPPRDLLSYPVSELAKNEWHNVIATGKFLNGKELYATPRYLKEQMGFGIITPLAIATPSGTQYVLVNRGWVPTQQKEPGTRQDGNPDITVKVEGVIRTHIQRGWLWQKFFTNLPEKNIWLWYDMPAMQRHIGLPLLPVMIDATRVTFENGKALKAGPLPFPLEINIRNDHLGYAITWFLIGISCVVIFVIYYAEKKK